MSRDVVEENRVGQQSSELSWSWRSDHKWETNQGEFLKECKLQALFTSGCLSVGELTIPSL